MICNLSFPKWRLRQISLALFPDARTDGKQRSWESVIEDEQQEENNIVGFEKKKRKEGQMSWGCFPKNPACISRPFYLLSISLKVNSLWAGTTSIRRPLLCKLLHLPAPAVAAPWPGLTAACLDRANAPFGSVPTSAS